MNVISASRRTDVPAFYWRWFMNRVDAGFCDVANPFNSRQVRRVSLRPADVAAIVFWTRDARPMIADIAQLEGAGYAFYVQYTLNGYPRELEPGAPERAESVAALRALSSRLGPDRVIWRYDPIVFSTATPTDYHVEQFSALARELRGAVNAVTISFCDPYGKTRRNFARLSNELGWSFEAGVPEQHAALAGWLAEAAAESSMQTLHLRRSCPARARGAERALHRSRSSLAFEARSGSPSARGSDSPGLWMRRVGGYRRVRHVRLRMRLLLRESQPRARAPAPCRARPGRRNAVASACSKRCRIREVGAGVAVCIRRQHVEVHLPRSRGADWLSPCSQLADREAEVARPWDSTRAGSEDSFAGSHGARGMFCPAAYPEAAAASRREIRVRSRGRPEASETTRDVSDPPRLVGEDMPVIIEVPAISRSALIPLFEGHRRDRALIDCVLEGHFGRARVNDASAPAVARVDCGPFTALGGDPASTDAEALIRSRAHRLGHARDGRVAGGPGARLCRPHQGDSVRDVVRGVSRRRRA